MPPKASDHFVAPQNGYPRFHKTLSLLRNVFSNTGVIFVGRRKLFSPSGLVGWWLTPRNTIHQMRAPRILQMQKHNPRFQKLCHI